MNVIFLFLGAVTLVSLGLFHRDKALTAVGLGLMWLGIASL